MKQLVWTKHEAVVEFRALTNAIDATAEPDRVKLHLQEIIKMAKKIISKELFANIYWLNN